MALANIYNTMLNNNGNSDILALFLIGKPLVILY